jgi:hypothetical protein
MLETKRKDWEELCKAVAEAEDPKELLSLVDRLNELFDQEDRARAERSRRRVPPFGETLC